MKVCLVVLIALGLVSDAFGQTIEAEIQKAQAEIASTKPWVGPDTVAGWGLLVGGTAWVVLGAYQSPGGNAREVALLGGLAVELAGGGLVAWAGGAEKRINLLQDRIDYVGAAPIPDLEKTQVLRGEVAVGMRETSFLLAAGPPMDFDTDSPTGTRRQLIYPWGSAFSDRGTITSIQKNESPWMQN